MKICLLHSGWRDCNGLFDRSSINIGLVSGLGIMLIFLMFPVGTLAWPGPYGHYDSYFNFVGDYPNNKSVAWDWQVQGLAHDESHWFITRRDMIWKIPVKQDLITVTSGSPGVKTLNIEDAGMPEQYDHFGDLDYYEYDGTGYLIVPVEDSPKTNPAIAIFRSSDLAPVGYAWLPQPPPDISRIDQVAWAAVDNQGHIYSSDEDDDYYTEYQVDWDVLKTSGTVSILRITTHPFIDEDGNAIFFHPPQGGEFSDSGRLLYISAGAFNIAQNDGINVFDTLTHRRIAYSSRTDYPFRYSWDNTYHETEGLTIWDLDGLEAPGYNGQFIEGQLHVLILDWEPSDDDVYISHFSRWLYIDQTYQGFELGIPQQPYKTLESGNTNIWNGGGLKVRPGSYAETLTLQKEILVDKWDDGTGGTVIIGE